MTKMMQKIFTVLSAVWASIVLYWVIGPDNLDVSEAFFFFLGPTIGLYALLRAIQHDPYRVIGYAVSGFTIVVVAPWAMTVFGTWVVLAALVALILAVIAVDHIVGD